MTSVFLNDFDAQWSEVREDAQVERVLEAVQEWVG